VEELNLSKERFLLGFPEKLVWSIIHPYRHLLIGGYGGLF